jgi:hypothetical protein
VSKHSKLRSPLGIEREFRSRRQPRASLVSESQDAVPARDIPEKKL